jgi:hypothetical protein
MRMSRAQKLMTGPALTLTALILAGCTAPYYDDGLGYDQIFLTPVEEEVVIIYPNPHYPPPPPPPITVHVQTTEPPRHRPLTRPDTPRTKTPRGERGADKPVIVRHKEKNPDPIAQVENRRPQRRSTQRR